MAGMEMEMTFGDEGQTALQDSYETVLFDHQ